jgi:hypothetical protein
MSLESFLAEYERSTEPMFTGVSEADPDYADLRYNSMYQRNTELHLVPKNDATEDIGPYIYLAFIGTYERGNGHGSAALTWLCELADRHSVHITGHADSKTRTLRDMLEKKRTRGLSKKQLRAWYERHGFRFQLPDGTPTRKFFYRSPVRWHPAQTA